MSSGKEHQIFFDLVREHPLWEAIPELIKFWMVSQAQQTRYPEYVGHGFLPPLAI
jgi:hypothetical protein